MAKLIAPLFSFGASGQLAKVLVYMTWKGIDDVRSYVVPANPRSADQQSQRSYFTDGVDLWHEVGLVADDITAWNRAASVAPKPQSGFNRFTSNVIGYRMDGIAKADIDQGFNGSIADSGVGQVDFSVEEDGDADAVDFIWGYSPTSLINTQAGSELLNVWSAADVVVNSGAIVYMKAIIKAAAVEIGTTGIYRFGPTS